MSTGSNEDTDRADDLGGPSPEGRQGSSAGTGEFLTADVRLYRTDETPEAADVERAKVEVSSHRFRRAPARTLIEAIEEAGADLESTERIDVKIAGEELTLRQTGWEIQQAPS